MANNDHACKLLAIGMSTLLPVQFALLAFLLGHSLEAFGQWKALLRLLLSCNDAPVHSLSAFYAEALSVVHAQLSHCLANSRYPCHPMPVASSASIKGCRTWELPDPAIEPRWGSALLNGAMNGFKHENSVLSGPCCPLSSEKPGSAAGTQGPRRTRCSWG